MIWCVDDDSTIREIEVYTLESIGFSARGFADGKAMFSALKKEKPELIVLDIMLPDEDGVDILKRLRKDPDTQKIPVIMATAKGTEIDKIQSLDLGADDYLVKPFGVMEMVARIKAVLRRCESDAAQETHCFGDIFLNESEHTVFVNTERIELTLKEFELLRLFLKNPNRVFSREKLLESVWNADYAGETRTVDMHIKTLRRKLGKSGTYIETVIGVGYRLGADR